MRRRVAARQGLSHARGAQRIQQRHRWTGRLGEAGAERCHEESLDCQILAEVWRWEISSPNNRFVCPLELQISRKRKLEHHPCWLVIGARPHSGIWTAALAFKQSSYRWPVATSTCLELSGMHKVKRERLFCQPLQGFALHIWWEVQLIVGISLMPFLSLADSAASVGGQQGQHHISSQDRPLVWRHAHAHCITSLPISGAASSQAVHLGLKAGAWDRVCTAASPWWAVSLRLFMSTLTKPSPLMLSTAGIFHSHQAR